jgi:hypothetical protein
MSRVYIKTVLSRTLSTLLNQRDPDTREVEEVDAQITLRAREFEELVARDGYCPEPPQIRRSHEVDRSK